MRSSRMRTNFPSARERRDDDRGFAMHDRPFARLGCVGVRTSSVATVRCGVLKWISLPTVFQPSRSRTRLLFCTREVMDGAAKSESPPTLSGAAMTPWQFWAHIPAGAERKRLQRGVGLVRRQSHRDVFCFGQNKFPQLKFHPSDRECANKCSAISCASVSINLSWRPETKAAGPAQTASVIDCARDRHRDQRSDGAVAR